MLTEHMLKKNKLKITIVCDVLGEENNGTTIAAMNLIRYLRQAGHEVHVLCPDKTKKDLEGYYVVPTRSFGVFTGYIEKNGVSLAKADDKTVRAAINGSDVVHIMLPFTLGKKAIQVAKEMNIPITTGFHLLAENFSSHIFMKDAKFTNRLLYSYFHSAYKECDAIHYPTQYLRDLNEKMYGKTNGYVISNGVNDMFRPLPDKKPFDGIYRIVYTGRYSREKSHKTLISGVARSKYKDKIKLILAGDGPLKESIKRRIDEEGINAEMNFFSREQLVRVLNDAYLYVHAAEIEAEGIGCLEAIACGLVPVICDSDRCATKSYALTDKSLFKNRDPDDLAAKIDWWIEHPEKRAEYSEKYAAFASDDLKQSECMKKMENMLLETARRFRGAHSLQEPNRP